MALHAAALSQVQYLWCWITTYENENIDSDDGEDVDSGVMKALNEQVLNVYTTFTIKLKSLDLLTHRIRKQN